MTAYFIVQGIKRTSQPEKQETRQAVLEWVPRPIPESTYRFSRKIFALTKFFPITVGFHPKYAPEGSTLNSGYSSMGVCGGSLD